MAGASLTCRKGYKSGPARFVEHANVWSLLGCASFRLVGEPTLIAGTQTRGELATVAVDVDERLGFRFQSGHERIGSRLGDLRTERFLFTLVRERRPPLMGCWLVQGLLPTREHMLFNGDSGADNSA